MAKKEEKVNKNIVCQLKKVPSYTLALVMHSKIVKGADRRESSFVKEVSLTGVQFPTAPQI